MPGQTKTIYGRVLDLLSGEGIANLTVKSFELGVAPKIIATVETEEGGYFRMEVSLDGLASPGRRLYFQLYDDTKLEGDSRSYAVWQPALENALITLYADPGLHEMGFPREGRRSVSGLVYDEEGRPGAGLAVKIFNRFLGYEYPLGGCLANERGFYSFEYGSGALHRPDQERANLKVQLIREGSILLSSPLVLNAEDHESLNLSLAEEGGRQTPPEFDLVEAALRDKLGEALFSVPSDWEADIPALAKSTGIPVEKITRINQAMALEGSCGHSVSRAAFYGLFSAQAAAGAQAGSLYNLSALLGEAEEKNIVRLPEPPEQVAQAMAKEVAAQAAAAGQNGGKPVLLRLAQSAGLSAGQQRQFLQAVFEEGFSWPRTWSALKQKEGFSDATIARLSNTLQLGMATLNHTELIGKLAGIKNIRTLRGLAGMGPVVLRQFMEENDIEAPEVVKGEGRAEKLRNYTRAVGRTVERMYPTDVIRRRLSAEARNIPGKAEVKAFLDKNPDFDFRCRSITSYLDSHPRAMEGVSDQEKTIASLALWKRLFGLAPNAFYYDLVAALAGNGITSAFQVANMGESAFVEQYSGILEGDVNARLSYERAAVKAGAALNVAARFSRQFQHAPMYVMPERPDYGLNGELASLERLFGEMDHCQCDQGDSILGPAAYLADLLFFLKNVDGAMGQLQKRRPDIEYIQLSKANAFTAMPYIDLVNEILEDAVQPRTFTLPMAAVSSLNAGVVSDSIARVFAENGFPLPAEATLTPVTRNEAWNLSAPNGEFLIRKPQPIVFPGSPQLNKPPVVKAYPQTSLPEAELRAHPQFVNEKAYELLAGKEYPWTGPFRLFDEEAGVYLKHLGYSRDELMRVFQDPNKAQAEVSDLDIAMEYLGVSPLERDILAGNHQSGKTLEERLKIYYNTSELEKLTTSLSALLAQSMLSYEALKALLQTSFINPGRSVQLVFEEDSCALEKGRLQFSGGGALEFLGRLHRFRRLQSRLGWAPADLSLALKALDASGAGLLKPGQGEKCLLQLANIHRIQTLTGLPVKVLMAWWGPASTGAEGDALSLYEQLFLNNNALNPSEKAIFQLNDDKSELRDVSRKISDNVSVISAATGMSEADIGYMLRGLPSPPVEDALTLGTLSALYRYQVLSQVLKVSIEELLVISRLSLADPFQPMLPEAALDFMEIVQRFRASSFTLEELSYLLLHEWTPRSATAQEEEEVGKWLETLRDKARDIFQEYPEEPEPGRELCRRSFLKIYPEEQAAMAMRIAEGALFDFLFDTEEDISEYLYKPAAGQELVDLFAAHGRRLRLGAPIKKEESGALLVQLMVVAPAEISLVRIRKESRGFSFHGMSPMKWINYLNRNLSDVFDLAQDKDKLIDPWPGGYLGNPEERYRYVYGKALYAIRRNASKGSLIQYVAETMNLSQLVAEGLLGRWVKHPGRAGRTALDGLLEETFIASQGVPAVNEQPVQFRIFYLLHKAGLIIGRLGIGIEELPLLFQQDDSLNWLPLFDAHLLPSESGRQMRMYFQGLDELAGLFRFRDKYKVEAGVFMDCIAHPYQSKSPNLDVFLEKLSRLALWPLDELASLWSKMGLAVSQGRYASLLWQLDAAFSMARRAGVPVGRLFQWAQAGITAEHARQIHQAARSKYDVEKWAEASAPLRNALRTKQRDALAGYLLAYGIQGNRLFSTADDIYSFFLIDPQMSPCMMTSRIKQAAAVIQLFIQRIQLNLEGSPPIVMDSGQGEEWEWRKNYRLWEANRKVFLYPENWIEPELRPDKSPFFIELEQELMQNEVTEESVEAALEHYLEKLKEVARLEIKGLYVEEEQPWAHVFARTYGHPHRYFYRRRHTGLRYWTPWEPVDIDIEAEQLLPVVWKEKVFLFWPVLIEEGENTIPGSNDSKLPRKKVKMRMAVAVKEKNRWQGKRLSKEQKEIAGDPASFCYSSRIDEANDRVEIQVSRFVEPGYTPVVALFHYASDGNLALGHHEGNADHPFIAPGSSYLSNLKYVENVDGPGREAPLQFGSQVVLEKTPGAFRVLPPWQQFLQNRDYTYLPFFYEDAMRTYFAFPATDLAQAGGAASDVVVVPYGGSADDGDMIQGANLYEVARSVWGQATESPAVGAAPENGAFPERPLFFSPGSQHLILDRKNGIRELSRVFAGGSMAAVQPKPSPFLPVNLPVFPGTGAIHQVESAGLILNALAPKPAGAGPSDQVSLFLSEGQEWDPGLRFFHFTTFYHPFAGLFLKQFRRHGSRELYCPSPSRFMVFGQDWNVLHRQKGESLSYSFESQYQPVLPTSEAKVLKGFSMLRLVADDPVIDKVSANFKFQIVVDGYNSGWSRSYRLRPQLSEEGINEHNGVQVSGAFPFKADFRINVRLFYANGGEQSLYIPVTKGIGNYGSMLYFSVPNPSGGDPYRFSLAANYRLENYVPRPYPREDVDFTFDGAYCLYNWELFVHIPMLAASRLSQNQQFEAARKWFHFMFDPTETYEADVPLEEEFYRRFWKVKPFFDEYDKFFVRLELEKILSEGLDPALVLQVRRWREHPFQPHLIAQLRRMAYMKTVVMKYLENLIAWADQLFRRDTTESINEAAQLYVLAGRILGRRPVQLDNRPGSAPTFASLPSEPEAVDLFQALESLIHLPAGEGSSTGHANQGDGLLATVGIFCLPCNEKIFSYWDTVEGRLFKIRHCMNIEGLTRSLPLFEPPIEPGLLVRAAAAGLSPAEAMSQLTAVLPHHRFTFMLGKAIEFCQEVRNLGGALLSAIEKRDAEELSLLRHAQELSILKLIKTSRKQQAVEARLAIESLAEGVKLMDLRIDYYRSLLGLSSLPKKGEVPKVKPHLIPAEKKQLQSLESAHHKQKEAAGLEKAAQVYGMIPDFALGTAGMAGSPVATAKLGGTLMSMVARAVASYVQMQADEFAFAASQAAILASHERAAESWALQLALPIQEKEQAKKQQLAAEIRLAMAEHELEIQEKQIANSEEAAAFLTGKFSNAALYSWMVSELSRLYFQAYQMAFTLARQAERAYQFEQDAPEQRFIQFGYWDSLKKGLLAGDKLYQGLKQMELAYLESNRRAYELTKHFSLALWNPEALLQLRETGSCFFDIPEIIFDLDYPGHYLRRIRSVSLTIPCITGPYTSVGARLTLLSNRMRFKPSLAGDYSYQGIEDPDFRHELAGIQSMATSSAQNDSGLFELSFRDERYLPFEGAGAISSWRLELPEEFRQFDYQTISDVIIHMNYTARDGGDGFKGKVNAHIREEADKWLATLERTGSGMPRLFSMREDFPEAWDDLVTGPGYHSEFKISHRHFPYFMRGRKIEIKNIALFFEPQQKGEDIEGWIRQTKVSGFPEDAGNNIVVNPAFEGTDMQMILYELNASIAETEYWAATIENPVLINGQGVVEQGFTDEQVKNVFLLVFYSVA